jgi:hypothetical protein
MFGFYRYNDSDTLLPRPATVSSTPVLPPISLVIDPALLGSSISSNTAHAVHSHSTASPIVDPAQSPKPYRGVAMEQVASRPFTKKEIEMVANIPDRELVSTGNEEGQTVTKI